MDKPTILHIDDEKMFSEGLAASLEDQFTVVWAHSDGEIAAALRHDRFDLILLDIDLGESRNALSLMALLQQPGIPILVLSNRATNPDKRALARLGARGYMPKNGTLAQLVDAMRIVMAGHAHFSPDFMSAITAQTGTELPHMTGQQTVMLSHLLRHPGRRTTSIAAEMGVSENWAQTLISQLMSSYQVHNRASLIEEARKRGFVPQQDKFDAAA